MSAASVPGVGQRQREYWATMRYQPVTPDLVTHRHTCPDGTQVTVTSQYMASLGNTLDRWTVGGVSMGTTARSGDNTTPPDYGWVDARATS